MRGTWCVVFSAARPAIAEAGHATVRNHALRTTHPASKLARQQEAVNNGAEGARTPDLLGPIQALSQLSYSPDGSGNLDAGSLTDNP